MKSYSITLKSSFALPPGFYVQHETVDNEEQYFLVRQIDQRRARITFVPGEARYTPQFLSSHMAEDADFDDPRLKGFL